MVRAAETAMASMALRMLMLLAAGAFLLTVPISAAEPGSAGALAGRVLALDSSPLLNVVVQVVHAGPDPSAVGAPPAEAPRGTAHVVKSAMTDSQGRFQFDGLTPGRYRVRLHRPGQLVYFAGGQELALESGQSIDQINFSISPFKKGTWKTFTAQDGLAGLSVRSLLTDAQGRLWIGTRAGLSRFDGNLFTSLTTEDGLPGNNIAGLAQDARGNLWIACDGGGLTRFDGEQFHHAGAETPLLEMGLQSVVVAADGTVWAAAGAHGLLRRNHHGLAVFTPANGLPAKEVYKVHAGPDGKLWLGTDRGLVQFDGVRFVNVNQAAGLEAFEVDSPRVAPDGSVWFGSWDRGVWRYDPAQGLTNRAAFRHWTEHDGLVDNTVWSIAFAEPGIVWIATGGGVSRFDGDTFINYRKEDGLAENHVSVIWPDPEGILWFATQAGLARYDTRSAHTFSTADGLPVNTIVSGYRAKDGTLWFSTPAGATRWDGTSFKTFTPEDGLPSQYVKSVRQTSDGRLWFATARGLAVFDGRRFARVPIPKGLPRDLEVAYARQLEQEKRRYNDLLHILLPHPVAEELKRDHGVKPRRQERVAVLFCDVVGFTPWCAQHPPEEIIENLQSLFGGFENLIDQHGLEKIQTVGDCMMAAAGALEPMETPLLNSVRCALDMVAAAQNHPARWSVHIGIHAGPVITGVLGLKRFRFDLVGDTVNTAARIQAQAPPNAVCVSHECWHTIQHLCQGHSLGLQPLKGKDPMEIFRIDNIK